MTKTTTSITCSVLALMLVFTLCAVPYVFMGAPAEGVIKVRKGSTIDMISDSLQAQVDVSFGKRVATLMKLMNAKVEIVREHSASSRACRPSPQPAASRTASKME